MDCFFLRMICKIYIRYVISLVLTLEALKRLIFQLNLTNIIALIKFMLIKSVLLLILILHTNASTCGGNCPTKDCTACYCGSTKNIISLESYCSLSNVWDYTCCKCIASHVSGANSNYMSGTSDIYIGKIGVLGVLDYGYDYFNCKIYNPKNLCEVQKNAKCAEKQYMESGWNQWADQAKACGCLPMEDNIQDIIFKKVKELKPLINQ